MVEQTMEEKLKICGRDFCVDIPDMDCESCQYMKRDEQGELLLTDEEVSKIWSGFTRDYGTLTRPILSKLFLAQLAKVKQHYEQYGKEVFTKIRRANRGEAVVFDWALDSIEIQWLYEMARQKRLDRPDREKIIDLLHWTEYTFIGQGNAIFEGILTQESEEQIADKLIALIPDNKLLVDSLREIITSLEAKVKDAKQQNTEQIDAMLVEARRTAKKQERVVLGTWLSNNIKAIGGGKSSWFKQVVKKLLDGQALQDTDKEEKE